ncbi:unnamed protein product [Amoebophrya sp. A120]|nr:unnamed protein product [Amoebophrya sp. A120]|eukprot:GSA120T00007226001.1
MVSPTASDQHQTRRGLNLQVDKAALRAKMKQDLLAKSKNKTADTPTLSTPAQSPLEQVFPPSTSSTPDITLSQIIEQKRLGTHFFKQADYEKAATEYTKGVTLCKQRLLSVSSSSSPETTTTSDEQQTFAEAQSIREKLAGMLGNRALCFLQLNENEKAFKDCEKCLELFPLSDNCAHSSCKYAYRQAVAGEKMGLSGVEKEECLKKLYMAADRLKALDLEREAEVAMGLLFKWSCQVPHDSLKLLAKSSGFDVEDDFDEHEFVNNANRIEEQINPNSDYFKVPVPKEEKFVKHAQPIPAIKDSSGAEVVPSSSSLDSCSPTDEEVGSSIAIQTNANPSSSDPIPAIAASGTSKAVQSRIDLEAMRKRLEKIAEDTERTMQEILSKDEYKATALARSNENFDGTANDPQVDKDGDDETANSPTSKVGSTTVRKIGEFVPIKFPGVEDGSEDDDSDSEADEEEAAKTAEEKLSDLDKQKLQVFQEFARRREQKEKLLARWRSPVRSNSAGEERKLEN